MIRKLSVLTLLAVVSAGGAIIGAASYSGVWFLVEPTGTRPSPRNQVSSQYDQANDRLIMTGGNNYGSLQNDVWVLVNAAQVAGASHWVQLAPSGPLPPVREAHASGYDPASNRLVIHGGWPGLADTWVLTHANGLGGVPTWTQLPTAPFDRSAPAYAYDTAHNRLIIYGGLDVNYYTIQGWHNDVWVLTDANGIGSPTWVQLHPVGAPPPPRTWAAAAYDGASNRLIVHGGEGEVGLLDDLWVLTNANGLGGTPEWINYPAVGPTPRTAHHLAYDSVRKRAVVVGGYVGGHPFASDAWILDNADGLGGAPVWHSVAATGPDFGGNVAAASAYSATSGRFVLALGALGGSYRNDVWHLQLEELDTDPPNFTCGEPPAGWQSADVHIPCTSEDSGSGLADPDDASFWLSTEVAPDTEVADAATGTRDICDIAGNCDTAGPITEIKVDKRAPQIVIATPTVSSYVLGQSVIADFSCVDLGSGVESCVGTADDGGEIATHSVGSSTFSVSAADAVGNRSTVAIAYVVTYGVCVRHDPEKVHKSGSTAVLKIELCDNAGRNVSSADRVVTALGIHNAATGAPAPLQVRGHAAAGTDFRFADGAYLFNLNLRGLSAGTWVLTFSAGQDPSVHAIQVQVR